MRWTSVVILVVILAHSGILLTDTIVFQPGAQSEDAYIEENIPNANYGSSSNLSVGNL